MTDGLLKPLLVAGIVVVGWGIAGLVDQANVPYDGFTTGPDNTVIRVRAGSPSAAAGLTVGDRLVRVNGISIQDTPRLTRMPRAAIGETRTILVERAATELNTVTQDVAITYAPQPGRDRALGWAGFVIGLCYVAFGLFAYARAPGQASFLLAMTGLCLGLTFLGGPYVASYSIRTAIQTVALVLIVMGFATLLHGLAIFPRRKAMLARRSTTLALYAPAGLIALLFTWLIVFEPAGTASLNRVVSALVGVFVVGYFGLSVIALVHSFATATPRERGEQGLNTLLAGVLLGLAPVTIASLVGIFAPSIVLPGSDFYALTLVLVPVALAMAVVRQAPAQRSPAMSFTAGR